jgi:hypothetical protein
MMAPDEYDDDRFVEEDDLEQDGSSLCMTHLASGLDQLTVVKLTNTHANHLH